jgi:hypothetical protein
LHHFFLDTRNFYAKNGHEIQKTRSFHSYTNYVDLCIIVIIGSNARV